MTTLKFNKLCGFNTFQIKKKSVVLVTANKLYKLYFMCYTLFKFDLKGILNARADAVPGPGCEDNHLPPSSGIV